MSKTTWKPNKAFYVLLVLFIITWGSTLAAVTIFRPTNAPFNALLLTLIAGPVLFGAAAFLVEIYRLVKGRTMNWPTVILATVLQLDIPLHLIMFMNILNE